MIGRLHGTIVEKLAPVLLLDVNGVGYELEAPMSTFYQLPEIGNDVVLYTHLAVRDDAHTLYGFASDAERALFRSLIRVNGVGPRLALTILSGISVHDFSHCVRNSDTATLVRLPGVGKKTAERLLVEMRDRIDSEVLLAEEAAETGATVTHADNSVSDAVSALVSLGYKPQEASRMVRSMDTSGMNSEEIIRRALQAAVG